MLLPVLLAAALAAPPAPDAAALFKNAVNRHQAGDLDGAIREYHAYLKLRPRAVDARINLGAALSALGRYPEAITEYERALKFDTTNPGILINLGLAYYKSGDVPLAAIHFATARTWIPENHQNTLLLADCWLRMGENRKVIALLDALEKKNPNDGAVTYLLGTALIRANEVERGKVIIDRVLKYGESAEARMLVGTTHMTALDFPKAVAELKRAIELNPNLPSVHAYYGQALLNNGDSAGARAAFLKELASNPNDYDSNLQLGAMLREEQSYEEARKYLQRASRLRPGDLAARYQLALMTISDGKLEEARQELEAILARAPKFTQAHISLATVYYRLKRKEDGDREREIVKQLKDEEDKRRLQAPAGDGK